MTYNNRTPEQTRLANELQVSQMNDTKLTAQDFVDKHSKHIAGTLEAYAEEEIRRRDILEIDDTMWGLFKQIQRLLDDKDIDNDKMKKAMQLEKYLGGLLVAKMQQKAREQENGE